MINNCQYIELKENKKKKENKALLPVLCGSLISNRTQNLKIEWILSRITLTLEIYDRKDFNL